MICGKESFVACFSLYLLSSTSSCSGDLHVDGVRPVLALCHNIRSCLQPLATLSSPLHHQPPPGEPSLWFLSSRLSEEREPLPEAPTWATRTPGNAKCFGDPVTGRGIKVVFLSTRRRGGFLAPPTRRKLVFPGQNTHREVAHEPATCGHHCGRTSEDSHHPQNGESIDESVPPPTPRSCRTLAA